MSEKVIKMWSGVYRMPRTFFDDWDTNMLIEAWHSVLKGKFSTANRTIVWITFSTSA
ncbi:hypothetical protein DFH07DRAFT_844714 [Mycena maculata]|uniref:Uncharacterized protein n=1 Tax=Mycena maculata TaxID=230809 RepID=A0AAD7I4V4_9AGAR|nr:hypothetical protein DFH07DRAFT_844714 [Mycena maculata]